MTDLGSAERVVDLGPTMANSVDFVMGLVAVVNAVRDWVVARF